MDKLNVFISYAHRDADYFTVFNDGLKTHLYTSSKFNFGAWDDSKIHIGTFWDKEIKENLKSAGVAVLCVSGNFLNSKYIKEEEFTKLLEENHNTHIFPVYFNHCQMEAWQDLSAIQFFKPRGNKYEKPNSNDFAFCDLVKFTETNKEHIPNSNIELYILDFVRQIETALASRAPLPGAEKTVVKENFQQPVITKIQKVQKQASVSFMHLDHSHTKAILICNSEYPHWPKGDIKNIRVNLEKLKSVLCDSQYVGIKDNPDHYIELLNKSKVDIQLKVSDFIGKCTPDDNLIIYYAGHGLLDIEDMKKLYLATSDTRIETKKITCISSEELKEPLMKCKAGNKIMILDCCYAAKAAGLQSDAASLGGSYWGNTEGVYFLMSSDVDEPSRFDPNDNTIPTFFTQKLVQTISEGADSDRAIWTLDDLIGVMKQKWDKKIAPEPINLTFKGVGGMPFCYNQYVIAKTKKIILNDDQRKWEEIKSYPTDENIREFIVNCKDSQLKEDALSLWDKVTSDWELLSIALAEGTYAALRKFISEHKPEQPVLEVATEKMKAINTENRNRSLNQPVVRARGGSMENIGTTAPSSANADRNKPGND